VEESTEKTLPSLPVRLLKVFFSPGEIFAALKEKPVWFGAMLVCAVVVGAAMAVIPTDLWIEVARNSMIERGQEVPAGFEGSGGIIKVFSILGAVIMTPVMMFVLAGIVTLVFSFLAGGEGRYVQYLSMVTHASIISAVGALLLVPLKIAQGDPSITLSLGTFFSFLGEGYGLRVLKMLDLFALWSYVVMAIGVSKIDPKRSMGFALGFFLLFAVAFALIFGLFGG
jgi:hypothetical protein